MERKTEASRGERKRESQEQFKSAIKLPVHKAAPIHAAVYIAAV
jgi:hypothetical protein